MVCLCQPLWAVLVGERGEGRYHDKRSANGVPRVLELLLGNIAPLGGLFGFGFVAL